MVPLFEAENEENLENVYDQDQSCVKSNSSGRLACLCGGEVHADDDDEFVVIDDSVANDNVATSNTIVQRLVYLSSPCNGNFLRYKIATVYHYHDTVNW